MLAIRLGQSLPSSEPTRWMPTDEIRLEAWYRKGTGITFVGSNPSTVSTWRNQSENAHHMVQATVSEQPTFETSDGSLTFDPTDDNNLQTTDQISLAGTFTIGVRIYISAVGGIILGDNTTAGEFIKIFSTNKIRVKIDNATAVDIQLDSGVLTGAWATLILTRDASNLITLHWNGVAQADTETLSGTADIDTIGVRATDLNPLDASIKEVIIYANSTADLTSKIYTRLSSL